MEDSDLTSGSLETVFSCCSRHVTLHTQSSSTRLKFLRSNSSSESDCSGASYKFACGLRSVSHHLLGLGSQFTSYVPDLPKGSEGVDWRARRDAALAEPQHLASSKFSKMINYLEHLELLLGCDGNNEHYKPSGRRRHFVTLLAHISDFLPIEANSVSGSPKERRVKEWIDQVPVPFQFRTLAPPQDAPLPPSIATVLGQEPLSPDTGRTNYTARGSPAGSVSGSFSSGSSNGSHAAWSGRKGRSKQVNNQTILQPQLFDPKKPYQCTWCWMAFKKTCDWRRHEESQHAPQTEWICMPNGAEASVNGHRVCVLCCQINPDSFHLEKGHRQDYCLLCLPENRRFDRKDHLVQHLRNIHQIIVDKIRPVNMVAWEQSLFLPQSQLFWRCGFCDVPRMVWAQRQVHVAEHMKSGYEGSSWRRCICASEGIRQGTLEILKRVGLEEIFFQNCRKTWCGTIRTIPSGLPCHLPFSSAQQCRDHRLMYHNHTTILASFKYHSGHFLNSVELPDVACSVFWCGFCRQTFETGGADAYDCARLNHFSQFHSTIKPESESWNKMDISAEQSFYSRARDSISYEIPQADREQFACKLLEHQKQLGTPRSSGSKRPHQPEESEQGAVPASKRPRVTRD